MAVAGVLGTPLVIYNYLSFTYAPVWSETFGMQNLLPSPLPWELLLDFGVVLLLAPLGIFALRGRTTTQQAVVLTWLAVIALCIYAPVPYQRRFAFGIQPALAALAVLGWPVAKQGLAAALGRIGVPVAAGTGIARRVLGYGLVVLGFTTVVAAYFVVISSAVGGPPLPYYTVDRDTYALGEWVAAHSGPDDVVFASFDTGSAFGGMIPGHVYAGHTGVTIRPAEKKAEIASLYRGDLSRGEARRLLEAKRATFVVFGPEERKLGSWDPGAELALPIAARVGDAVAYRTLIDR